MTCMGRQAVIQALRGLATALENLSLDGWEEVAPTLSALAPVSEQGPITGSSVAYHWINNFT